MRAIWRGECELRFVGGSGVYECQHGDRWVRMRSGGLCRVPSKDVAVETVAAQGRGAGEAPSVQTATVPAASFGGAS